MINAKGGGLDFYSEAVFGDAVIEVEVMVPKGSNSGVYVMGEYEIQVLDSYGRKSSVAVTWGQSTVRRRPR